MTKIAGTLFKADRKREPRSYPPGAIRSTPTTAVTLPLAIPHPTDPPGQWYGLCRLEAGGEGGNP